MKNKLFYSNETIFHQDTRFFTSLVAIIEALKKEQPNLNRWAEPQAQAIAKVINKFCKSSVLLQFHEFLDAYYLGEIHEIISASIKNNQKLFLNGAVDLEKGQLKGDFSNKVSYIFITYNSLALLSSEEVAAVILHEVGHMMTTYELLSRAVRLSNYALKDIAEKYTTNLTVTEKRTILVDIKERLKELDIDVEDYLKAKDSVALTFLILSDFKDSIQSDLGCIPYDITSYEYLADQFATRMGAGRYIITALDKLDKTDFKKNHVAGFFDLFTSVTAVIGLPGAILASSLIFLITVYSLFRNIFALPSESSLAYDSQINRLKRIRLQMVSRMNDKRLPEAVRKSTVDDIHAIDAVIAATKSHPDFVRSFYNIVVPSLRMRTKAEKRQMLLESLALNDLFLRSFELTH